MSVFAGNKKGRGKSKQALLRTDKTRGNRELSLRLMERGQGLKRCIRTSERNAGSREHILTVLGKEGRSSVSASGRRKGGQAAFFIHNAAEERIDYACEGPLKDT